MGFVLASLTIVVVSLLGKQPSLAMQRAFAQMEAEMNTAEPVVPLTEEVAN